jgi:hypothetical protein
MCCPTWRCSGVALRCRYRQDCSVVKNETRIEVEESEGDDGWIVRAMVSIYRECGYAIE